MIRIANARRKLRRRQRALWTAALCSASFFTGQYLFGDDQPSPPAKEKPSLLRQYLEAKSDLVAPLMKIAPPSAEKFSAPAASENPPAEKTIAPIPVLRIQPAKPLAEKHAEPPQQKPPVKPVTVQLTPESRPEAPPAIHKAPELTKAPPKIELAEHKSATESGNALLRAAAVSPAADLPFIPAQPLPTTTEAVAVAPASPTVVPPVVQTPPPLLQSQPAPAQAQPAPSPSPQLAAAPTAPPKVDEEHLPPIVPAWAVPRPGTRKKLPSPPAAAPAPSAAPAAAVIAPAAPAPLAYAPPAVVPLTPATQMQVLPPALPAVPATPMKIELGGTLTPSPAVLPPPAPPATPGPRSSEKTSFQRLPPGEPSLLPPFAKAPQPIALEIFNPHVKRATFETPIERPTAPPQQHLDDNPQE